MNHLRCRIIVEARKTGKRLHIPIRGPLGLEGESTKISYTVDHDRHVSFLHAPRLFFGAHPLFTNTSFVCPRTWVREVGKSMVFGPTIGVVSSDNLLIPEVSIEWSCPSERHWTFRKLRLPSTTRLSGRSLILASTGGDSYFHWMTDVLPRIRLVTSAGIGLESFDHIIINQVKDAFQRETLQYAKIPPAKCREFRIKASGFLCEEAVLPSLPSFPGVIPPETIAYLTKLVPQTALKNGSKLFITRGASDRRRVIEQDQIAAWLMRQGFKVIDCGSMSVKDQAGAFAHADLIVAPHGGALTNLMFCRSGTQVVELLSSRYANPCYRNLCGVAGLPYIGIIGNTKTTKTSGDLSDSSGSIETTLEDLKKALEQIRA